MHKQEPFVNIETELRTTKVPSTASPRGREVAIEVNNINIEVNPE